MMLGQASIAEYLILVLMIVFISFMALLMIFGFQFFNVGSEQSKSLERRSLFLLESAISTTALNNLHYQQGSVLDDSKLTAATCEELETLLGRGWYAEVRAIPDESVCDDMPRYLMNACLKNVRKAAGTYCSTQNYPDCNVWEFCKENERVRMIFRSIPVNIYRKMNGTLQLGVLTIGIEAGG